MIRKVFNATAMWPPVLMYIEQREGVAPKGGSGATVDSRRERSDNCQAEGGRPVNSAGGCQNLVRSFLRRNLHDDSRSLEIFKRDGGGLAQRRGK